MKNLLTLFLLLFSLSLFSQKEANIWYFGFNAGIDFNSGNPVILEGGAILSPSGGTATISSAAGELLFYTEGQVIHNKNHNEMPNGFEIGGGNGSTQAAIIIPKPGDVNIYYVFTTTVAAGHRGLKYSIVDMRLDNGLGVVTDKAIPLITPVTEKLTAIKSTSFNGYWVLAHDWDNNKFLVYKVTSSGVDETPDEYNVGSIITGDGQNAEGQLKLAPDGKRLAMASGGNMNELQFFDFNSSTGEITNPVTIIDEDANTNIYGVEFSPNGEILYVSGDENGVYQYNLEAGSVTDIQASKLKLNNFNDVSYGSLQLAPDGKIYVGKRGHFHLDYLTDPDVLGIGCGYREFLGGLNLGTGRGGRGFPQFIQSYFYVGFSFTNLCFEDSTEFTANINETYDTIQWDFGDGNTSIKENPMHTFLSAGIYTVTLTVTSGSETSVETEEVIIYEVPTATQPINMLPCDADNNGFHNFNLTTQNLAILNGQNSSDFSVDYYASITDYNNDNPIPNYTSYQNITAYQSQTIIARVKNNNNANCVATTTFDIQVFESPRPALNTDIPNLSDCDNTSVGTDTDGRIQFDLTDRETAILNGQLTTDFEVTYFTDAAYTMQIPTADVTTYENTNTPQTIYARVTNRNNATCVDNTSFVLEVFELPTVAPVVSLRQCDNDIDGFSFFNLTEVNEEIITNSSSYTITYFETETQAQNDDTPITNFTAYENETVSTDTVWARIENANGCFRTSQIDLFVSTTQIPLTYTREFYECDDGTNTTDGIATFDFSQVTTEIQNIFPVGQQLIIKYYQSEGEALAEENPIPDADISNYQNTTSPNQQEIYIRVDSAVDNDCLGLGHHITLNVEAQPVANPVTIDPQCDNDRDGFFSFDTSNIQSTILGTQSGMQLSYVDENGVALPSPLPNPFSTASQTITARITNTTSQDPDGQCYAETTIDFVVNEVPIANPVTPLEQCDDDTDVIVAFDTSTIESTILGTQTGMVVKYFDENGTALPSPLPNPFSTASQTITVRIENPIYAVCFEETTVEFIVREKPTVQTEPDTVICMTDSPSKDISVENPNSTYTYTWSNQSGTQIGTGETITVNQGGIYSVIATSQFNCDSLKEEITVIESEIAMLTLNDIEITDDSDNNSIVIDAFTLGQGDYEYALLDVNLNFIYNFQDSPNFTNLNGGIYTIQIRDKNDCGIAEQEVSVISYPNFITPNNDGHNDVWAIKGFSSSFYPTNVIYIYNRFGKVIAQLPADNPIWNGYYKGKPAPSNDYWFSVQLTDANGNVRTKKGYFSLLRK